MKVVYDIRFTVEGGARVSEAARRREPEEIFAAVLAAIEVLGLHHAGDVNVRRCDERQ